MPRSNDLSNFPNSNNSIKILCTEQDLTIGWLYSEFIRKVRDLKEFDLTNFCYFRTTSEKFGVDYILTQYNRPLFEIPHNTILVPIFKQGAKPENPVQDYSPNTMKIEIMGDPEISKTNFIQAEDFEYLKFLGEGGFAHIFLVTFFVANKNRSAASRRASSMQ